MTDTLICSLLKDVTACILAGTDHLYRHMMISMPFVFSSHIQPFFFHRNTDNYKILLSVKFFLG